VAFVKKNQWSQTARERPVEIITIVDGKESYVNQKTEMETKGKIESVPAIRAADYELFPRKQAANEDSVEPIVGMVGATGLEPVTSSV
jgi:hypothetical protein